MTKIPGLVRRNNTFSVRVRVPKDIEQQYGKKEITRALGTPDYSVATKRIHAVRAGIEAEFEKVRKAAQGVAGDADMLSRYSEHELTAMTLKWLHGMQAKQQKRRVSDTATWSNGEIRNHHIELEQEELTAREEMLGVSQQDKHEGLTLAAKLLTAEGITFTRNSEQFRTLGYFFSKAIHDLAQQNLREMQGRLHLSAFTAASGNSGIVPAKSIDMRQLCAEYLKDPSRKRGRATIKNYNVIQRAITEVIGDDTPAHLVTREQCKEMRDLLVQLPSNALKKTKGKSLKKAVEIGKKKNLPLSADTTVNMHLQKLSAIFDYAVREGYCPRNFAKGLFVAEKVKKKQRRFPFDQTQLERIFNAPLYTGCLDDGHGYAQVGMAKPRNARFWVPLISLFSGMRLNEICQLNLADIAVKDGVNIIMIQADDAPEGGDDIEKRVKTEAGIRFVPVHPMLERIGFLQCVDERRKAGHKRLFPEISVGSYGDYAHGMSQWFTRFLVNASAKKHRTSFHSFRHNYRDALREAEIPTATAQQLGGWSRGATDDDYGVGVKTSTLMKHISKIQYPDLDLSHLYVKP